MSGVDHDDHCCCDVCAEAHDTAVRALEAEAIAKMVEQMFAAHYDHSQAKSASQQIAAAIRARKDGA